MNKLRVLDLFSGIGGFSLGLERTGGFETVAFCEIEPFPRRVLAKHWPEVPCYDDVRTLTGARLAADGIAVDVITGGFPCQDLSVAGKQSGMGEGTRSGLWSEIVRLIRDLSPRYVIVENVANLLSGPSEKRGGWFGRVLGDLAECGYDAEWENIPAAALGASHRRERIWVAAYPSEMRFNAGRSKQPLQGAWALGQARLADPHGVHEQGQQSRRSDAKERSGPLKRPSGPCLAELGRVWRVEPDVGRVAHGVPDRSHRLAGLGNAVVSQIPELIGRAILRIGGVGMTYHARAKAKAPRTPRANVSPNDLERALFMWPSVVERNKPGTFAGDFARGIASRSRRRSWKPSEKEWPIMRQLVAALYTEAREDDDDDFDLIDREDRT